jgi:hypothetical protein
MGKYLRPSTCGVSDPEVHAAPAMTSNYQREAIPGFRVLGLLKLKTVRKRMPLAMLAVKLDV